jgi:polyisoprenoid-binding protein YceI
MPNKTAVKKMGLKNGENMTFGKLFNLFVAGGLLTVVCAASLIKSAAVEDRAKPTQEKAAAEALPAPGTYWIDPDHSFAYFGASHHVVGLVRGRFDKVAGTFTVSQDLADCSVDVLIDASSISTQVPERDEDLRGPAYFDVKKFPTMTYHGRGIRHVSGGGWTMDGSLTLHGVTKVVPLTFSFNGLFGDAKPGKAARAAFDGSAATKRADFSMGARDKGEVGASGAPDVQIEIDVEADAKPPAQ